METSKSIPEIRWWKLGFWRIEQIENSVNCLIYDFCHFPAFPPEKQEMKRVYDTANFYHFVHTMALLAVPLARRPVLVSSSISSNMYHIPLNDTLYWYLYVFSEWYPNDWWNDSFLWNHLLPRLNRRENFKEIHTLWGRHAHYGLAHSCSLKQLQPSFLNKNIYRLKFAS